jgi:pimeloyl-ACP methyl ester carboxylesterase
MLALVKSTEPLCHWYSMISHEEKKMAKLNIVTRGRRENRALLLIHAFGTDHRFWEEAVWDLSRDYFCITPDLQAAGESPLPPEPVVLDQHCADLIEMLDDLGVPRAAFIGCAIGGMIAAALAARHPQRAAAVVMANPGTGNAEAFKGVLRDRVDLVRAKGMTALLPGAADRAFHGMPRDRRYDLYVERFAAQSAEAYALSVLGFLDIDIRPDLPDVECPLLLIPGGNDVIMPADAADTVAALAPRTQTIRLDGVGHFVPFQAPERFVAAVRPFLAEKAVW